MAAVSLISLYWWYMFVVVTLPTYIRAESLLSGLFRFYVVWGGNLGWASLAALVFLQYFETQRFLKWIAFGNIIGISVAVLLATTLSSIWWIAILPVIASSALLACSFMAAPNHAPHRDGREALHLGQSSSAPARGHER